ncbi:hypothetical protein GCM10009682_39490 [Luedemannella flava]|uniref:Uncharacterized protein n=1 Tax=Luedemannella flava TaxID=349316 RepID=A0ABP4YFM9_9ACTN
MSKLPDDLLEYGRRLLARAEDLAARHGLDPLNLVVPDRIPTLDEIVAGVEPPTTWSVEHRVDVAHSAGRWCVFWAERGHLLDVHA